MFLIEIILTRTIMLFPIGKSVGLTALSLSLIKLLYKENVIFFKPFLYTLHDFDDTSYILEKNFSVPHIRPVINYNDIYVSKKDNLKQKIQDIIDLYYSYKNKYDIIFIEGIKSDQDYIHNLNLMLLQHIDAEVIFYNSDDNVCLEKNIFFNELLSRMKNNILGVINNFCNISIDSYNDILFNTHIKKKYDYYINAHPFITTNIPWNRKIINFSMYKILKLIKIENLIKQKHRMYLINSFILYHHVLYHISDNISHSVLLIPLDIFFDKYYYFMDIIFKTNTIRCIILTNCDKNDIQKIHLLEKQMQYKVIFFYTFLKFKHIISIIYNFKINILYKDKDSIDVLLDYIINYINHRLILTLYTKNTKNNVHCSPIMFQKYLLEKAKSVQSHILLPEGSEKRIIHAASILANLGIVRFTLFGNLNNIYNIFKEKGFKISNNINIIDSKDIYNNYVEKFFLLRSHKGITWKLAEQFVQDNMILAALLLRDNQADGIVCGVQYTTAHVLRTAIQLIGLNNINSQYCLLSSAFFMLLKDTVLIYSDCAVNINPDAKQLSKIAVHTVNLANLFDIEPKIAMLSYATGLSGIGDTVEKVRQATNLIKKIYPNLIIEGPIQYDAAINSNISDIKLPLSSLHGKANIFIFPDLNSGNITYKAVQQSLNISSIGPILQGLIQPINDLSRGATVNDIIYTILVTAIQSHKK